MIEIERKFRLSLSQKENLHKKMHSLGIVFGDAITQSDMVFLQGVDSFKNFKQGEPVIRIRVANCETLLTFKRTINEVGDSIEHELIIGSAETMMEILNEMGYRLVTKVEKTRREVAVGHITIALDSVEGLGDFLEIEILTDKELVEKSEAEITKLALEFGLDDSDIEPKKYDRLMNELS